MATPPNVGPPAVQSSSITLHYQEAFRQFEENDPEQRIYIPVACPPPANKEGKDSSSSSSSSSDSSSDESSSSDSDKDQVDKAGIKNPGVPTTLKTALTTPAMKTKSSSSDDSSSDDSEDEKTKSLTKFKIPKNRIPGNEKGKLVAAGSVVNDKIRVVPIKEKTPRTAGGKGGKGKGRGRPPKCLNSSNHSEESDRAFAQSLEEKENTKRRSDRKRQSQPIYNEDYADHLLRESFTDNGTTASSSSLLTKKNSTRRDNRGRPRGSTRKVSTKKEKVDLDPSFEIGGDAPRTLLRPSGKTADWDSYLNAQDPDILKWIAEVSKFSHAPMSDIWKDFAKPGLKIEIPNCFVDCNRPVYWIATIKYFAGYKALIQYETFGYGDPLFAWISFCSSVPKQIGYCDENEILLFPPYGVLEANQGFLHLLRSVIHDYSLTTLKKDHVEIVASAIKSKAIYQLEDVVEAMDCSRGHLRRLARVTGIIADRVHVSYIGDDGAGFFFNVKGDGVRPLGWSQAVGLELTGVPKKTVLPQFDLSTMPSVPEEMYFRKDMVFEVVHPLHVHRIATGHIEKVYQYGYFLARIDCHPPLIPTMRFIFHISSPWVLPCGFCTKHGIDLAIPSGEREQSFNWDKYCATKGLRKLDLSPLLPRRANPFIPGEKFEAIDLRLPTACCPVTVMKIADHLLLLHFDGYSRGSQAFQWVDCDSPDIYPAGWSEMTGHEFQSQPEFPKVEDHSFRIIPD